MKYRLFFSLFWDIVRFETNSWPQITQGRLMEETKLTETKEFFMIFTTLINALKPEFANNSVSAIVMNLYGVVHLLGDEFLKPGITRAEVLDDVIAFLEAHKNASPSLPAPVPVPPVPTAPVAESSTPAPAVANETQAS